MGRKKKAWKKNVNKKNDSDYTSVEYFGFCFLSNVFLFIFEKNDIIIPKIHINKAEVTNELFIKYYQEQKIIPDGEWDDFINSLKQDLPQSWRFIGGKSFVFYPVNSNL